MLITHRKKCHTEQNAVFGNDVSLKRQTIMFILNNFEVLDLTFF